MDHHPGAGTAPLTPMRIDHVIVAVSDLDAAAWQMWEECGLASVEGGVHPGWGTGNRVIPLGFAYLELLGIVDADLALGSDVGRWIQQVSSDGDRLAAWSVEVDDLDEVARRLGLEVASGGRLRPDGRRLSFRLAGVEVARQRPWLPFFVAWDHAAMRPQPTRGEPPPGGAGPLLGGGLGRPDRARVVAGRGPSAGPVRPNGRHSSRGEQGGNQHLGRGVGAR